MTARLLLLGVLAAAIAPGAAGCRSAADPSPPSPPTPAAPLQTSPAAPPGVYLGTLPCADCPGIRTQLTLVGDPPAPSGGGTYTLKETYIGTRDGDRSFDTTGRWLVLRGSADDRDATVYQLNPQPSGDPRYLLRVNDDELRLLDRQQRTIVSAFDYTLRRAGRTTPGGYAAIETSMPEVQAAAGFAVKARAQSSGQVITLTTVARAERQVVKGMNDRLCLDVTIDGSGQRVLAHVYRDLNQTHTLTQWAPGTCDTR